MDCLYLRPTANHQGGHELLHLGTNRVITRNKVTPVPMTPAVIKLVHSIARNEGRPEGLKIENRANTVLFDAAWTAGVEYDEDLFDNEEEDPEYDTDNEDEDELDSTSNNEDDQYDDLDNNELLDILQEQYIIENEEDEPVEAEDNEEEVDTEEGSETENEEQDEEYLPNDNENDNAEEIINNVDKEDIEQRNENADAEIAGVRRSTREIKVPTRLGTLYQHLHREKEVEEVDEYSEETAQVLAQIMSHFTATNGKHISKKKFYQFVHTYTLNKGIKKYGMKGKQAAYKEMQQLHKRTIFKPIRIEDLTYLERKRAMESLIFLVEKTEESKQGHVRTVAHNELIYQKRRQKV